MNKAHAIANFDQAATTIEVILADMFLHGGSVLGDKLEKQLAGHLYSGYLKRAKKALDQATRRFERGKGEPTRAEVEDIAKVVGKELADIPDDEIEFLVSKTSEIYAATLKHWQEETDKVVRRELAKVKKVKKAVAPDLFEQAAFGVTFDLADAEAIEAMSRNQVFWIGDQYGKNVQAGILGKAETEIFEKGLGRKEAAGPLRQIISGQMGLDIPAQYRGTARSYFEGMAGLVRVQSNAFASVKSFKSAGVTKYEITAVGDERTCPECAFMDGTIFETGQGAGHISRIGKAKTPEQVKAVNKWMKRPAMMKLAKVKTPGAKKSVHGVRAMAKGGLALPPYHFRCRCTVEPAAFDPSVYEGGETAPLVQGFPYPENKMKSVPLSLDGMHAKSVYDAPDGTRWLFKPQPVWQSEVDVATAKIARRLGIDAPDIHSLKFRGQTGSMQRMYDDVEGSMRTLGRAKLTKAQAEAVQREHILDWLISNHDSHDGNLLLLKDKTVRGIDKGQAFKFFGRDKLWIDYNPNPSPSYYNTMFRRYIDGDDVTVVGFRSKPIQGLIKTIDEMPDDEFIALLRPYFEGAKKAGTLATSEKKFIELALARKRNIRKEFEAFYKRVESERKKVTGVAKPVPAKVAVTRKGSVQNIDAKFIKAVDEEAASLGRMFYIAGDDFEDMGMLAYKVGDDLVLESKLRQNAGLALAKRLDEEAVSVVTQAPIQDEAWDSVLKAVKSVNHHFGPGGDEKLQHLYFLQARKAIDELTDPAAKKYYTKILDSVIDKNKPLTKNAVIKGGLGKVHKPYTPKAKPKPVKGPKGYKVTKQDVDDKAKTFDFDEGKIKGSVTESGTVHSGRIQYTVKYDDGTRIEFVTQGDNNHTSRVGRIQIYPGRNTAASYKKALGHLDDLGLNSTLATEIDAELMYLQKATYAARLHGKAPFKSIMARKTLSPEEKIEALKEAWEKKLGRKLTKKTGYDPSPFYLHSKNRGVARWRRFDWLEDDIKDARLTHSLTGYNPNVAGEYLDLIRRLSRAGGLMSTEDRYRTGIQTLRRTMSPGRDMDTGGASYVFTRLKFKAERAKRTGADLIFKNDALRDMNTISYEGDKYGSVAKLAQRATTRDDLVRYSGPYSNETIVRQTLGFESLETIQVPRGVDPGDVKKILKEHGFGHVEVIQKAR